MRRAAEGDASGVTIVKGACPHDCPDTCALEVHVKDSARFPGGWAFFGFDDGQAAKPVPHDAACYACHAAHAAVDTTFVQFYPTLMPLAQARGTLSAAYQAENAGR